MRKNAAVPLFLLLALLVFGGATAAAQPPGADSARAEADAFLAKARASLAAGSMQEAADLLGPALQLAPDYSEALYLRARLDLADQATTLGAIDDLREALAKGSWTMTDPSVVQQTLAEVLVRTGAPSPSQAARRLVEAGALLSKLAARNPADPRTYELLARLYTREGNTGALRRVLADAVAKFPLDDDLALSSASLLEREGRRSGARRLIANQLTVHPASLSLLLRAAELEPTPGARVAAVDRYAAQGGKDPLAAVLALEAPARDRAKYLSQFIDNGGLSREDLVGRVALAARASRSLAEAFHSALSRYSGNRDLDQEGDGYYEERWTFEGGELTSWIRDSHEDGAPQYSAEFQKGTPTSLTVRAGADMLLDLAYSTYPFVKSVKEPASRDTGARILMLDPYTVKFPFLSGISPAAPGLAPRAMRNPGRPSIDQALRSSYMVEEYAPDGTTIARRIDMLRGKRVFMEEDTLGKGTFNHRVWYKNGAPVRGERDLDGNGRFAVTERWRDGRLASIAVDTRGDGKVSYRERYLPSPMKSWDYDEDGIDDSREYPVGPNMIARDFSTAMNGIFDVSYVWKRTDLISVRRHGQAVPVTHDTARGVVWIGRPAPAGAPFDASGAEGYRTIAGKLYLVFREEGATYAEELP